MGDKDSLPTRDTEYEAARAQVEQATEALRISVLEHVRAASAKTTAERIYADAGEQSKRAAAVRGRRVTEQNEAMARLARAQMALPMVWV
jgi:hypothetical protein